MPESNETVSEHLKKRLPVDFHFSSRTALSPKARWPRVSHHWQVEWPASITACATLLEVRLANTFTLS